MNCKSVKFNLSTREIKELNFDTKLDFSDPEVIYWVHLDSFNNEKIESYIKKLGLPNNVIKDLSELETLPIEKHDEDSLIIVVEYWECNSDKEPEKLLIYLTEKYCLTISEADIPALTSFNNTYKKEFRFAQTPGFILFLLLDNLIDDYASMLTKLDNFSEDIDLSIQKNFSKELNYKILDFKRTLLVLKRVVASIRDILMRISGRRISVISESCRLSLVDIYTHSQALVIELEALRELVSNSLDAYNTALTFKLNETMKVLTIFSAIILPMSFIASVYGMNFHIMPELEWKYGYLFALGLMAVIAFFLTIYFKKKGWIE